MIARSRALARRDRRAPSASSASGSAQRVAPDLLHVVDRMSAARGRSRAGRAARRRRCASSFGSRSEIERILSTCSWSSTTAIVDLGMVEHIGHLVGDRVGIDRHRNGAERLRRAHRPIEPRPVGADDGDLVAALEAELAAGRARRRAPRRAPAPRSRSARCRDPCAGSRAARRRCGHCGAEASETYRPCRWRRFAMAFFPPCSSAILDADGACCRRLPAVLSHVI